MNFTFIKSTLLLVHRPEYRTLFLFLGEGGGGGAYLKGGTYSKF